MYGVWPGLTPGVETNTREVRVSPASSSHPHPSTGASRHPTRLVRVSPVEVPEQVRVEDLATENPHPVLQVIPLPVDQVLLMTADVHNPPTSVGRHTVNDTCRRRIAGRWRKA